MVDAIIVLSHRLEKDGKLSKEYKQRLDKGIELFFKKRTKYLILCSETATKSIKKYIIKKGIKNNKILLQPKSRNTIEEAKFTKDILMQKKLRDIIIVSGDYHINYRANLIFDSIFGKEFSIEYVGIKSGRLREPETMKDQIKSLSYFINNHKEKKNILVIAAHPDDEVLGVGGTIAKHISNGDEVFVVYVTSGEYQNYDGKIIKNEEIAMKEARKSIEVLGVKKENLILLNLYKSKEVKYESKLIEELNKIIDNKKIDIIYTHWDDDVHQDHSAIGKATLNAGRHIPTILMYRSNWYASTKQFNCNFYSDISNFMDLKIKALKEHKTEVKHRGNNWIDFVKFENKTSGIEIGVEYAETFKIVKYLEDGR